MNKRFSKELGKMLSKIVASIVCAMIAWTITVVLAILVGGLFTLMGIGYAHEEWLTIYGWFGHFLGVGAGGLAFALRMTR